MTDYIPVNEPLLDGNEKKYLAECIDTGWISSEGPFVKRFEQEFAESVGRKYGIAVTNGTAAIDVAIEVLGIGPGDEVILPTFTIISCVHQIIRSGAKPVLVDSDLLTWNMNVNLIEQLITPKTKAVMAVHIYGLPVDMSPIENLCKEHNLFLIEDAAEMIGQRYRNKPCGSFGTISTVSFYPNKHITTGEGGMILTDDPCLAEQCRQLRNLCFQKGKRFVHERLGWNLRMTNLQAALGVAQLEKLDSFVDKKRLIGKKYSELLNDIPHIQLPLAKTDYAENIYWVFGIVIDSLVEINSSQLIEQMSSYGIGCRPFFCPMHLQPVLQGRIDSHPNSYPVSEQMYKYGCYLPSGLALTDDQILRVCDSVRKILLGKR